MTHSLGEEYCQDLSVKLLSRRGLERKHFLLEAEIKINHFDQLSD